MAVRKVPLFSVQSKMASGQKKEEQEWGLILDSTSLSVDTKSGRSSSIKSESTLTSSSTCKEEQDEEEKEEDDDDGGGEEDDDDEDDDRDGPGFFSTSPQSSGRLLIHADAAGTSMVVPERGRSRRRTGWSHPL